ncbi:hypothetical protein K4F52_006008 [Lecanicillium sp. MT-2017a]|nr:hypothetical protein K4F52_006008 [Lecanicillium sp. MT-2017a]
MATRFGQTLDLLIREIEEDAPRADAAVKMGERHFKYPFNTALVELLQHMTGLECFK